MKNAFYFTLLKALFSSPRYLNFCLGFLDMKKHDNPIRQQIKIIMQETFLLKNHTQNEVEKLFPNPFLRNQNWEYIWIKSRKFLLYAKLRAIEIY